MVLSLCPPWRRASEIINSEKHTLDEYFVCIVYVFLNLRLKSKGMYERAATVAVFNNDIPTAINILSEGSTVDYQSEKGIYILENVFHQRVNAHRVVVFTPNKYEMYRQKNPESRNQSSRPSVEAMALGNGIRNNQNRHGKCTLKSDLKSTVTAYSCIVVLLESN